MSLKAKLTSGHAPPSSLSDLFLTIARVGVGLAMALAHGYGKIPPHERFISGIEGMGFPAPIAFAWMAALAECAGGFLLAIGLFTRPATLFVGVTMAVAFFVAHGADPFDKREMAFLYLCLSLVFFAVGSGRFGIDRFLRGGAGAAAPAKPAAKKPKK